MAKTYTNIQRHGQGLIAIPVKVNKSIPGIKKRWCWVLDSNFFWYPRPTVNAECHCLTVIPNSPSPGV